MIAKGKVYISEEKLIELFNLPKDIDIIAVHHEMGKGIEFIVASEKPIGALTREVKNLDDIRRQSVPRAILRPSVSLSVEEVWEGCRCGNESGTRYRAGQFVICADCSRPIHRQIPDENL